VGYGIRSAGWRGCGPRAKQGKVGMRDAISVNVDNVSRIHLHFFNRLGYGFREGRR